MARKPIPESTIAKVLYDSRRRCCICFGLNHTTELVSGQIAHLDRKNTNSAYDNLAFLCFHHHDEYDSISSQRKNFTMAEVKLYRADLYANVSIAFSKTARFGEAVAEPIDPIAGTYILIDEGPMSAELRLTPLPQVFARPRRYQLDGFAVLDRNREMGAHTGHIDEIVDFADGVIRFGAGSSSLCDYKSEITFDGDGQASLEEWNMFGQYGWGVSFAGNYKRVDDENR